MNGFDFRSAVVASSITNSWIRTITTSSILGMLIKVILAAFITMQENSDSKSFTNFENFNIVV